MQGKPKVSNQKVHFEWIAIQKDVENDTKCRIKKILIENNLFHIQQDKNILCTDRALNDLIISYYISLVFNNSINIQKTYGYAIKNQYLYIYKDGAWPTLQSFIQYTLTQSTSTLNKS